MGKQYKLVKRLQNILILLDNYQELHSRNDLVFI